ncbi:unnamed protein product [Umbelopsis ramanniana]
MAESEVKAGEDSREISRYDDQVNPIQLLLLTSCKMDDLSDLVWSQPEKKKSPPQLPKKPANLTSNTAPK